LDLANGENLLHIEKSSPESQVECLKEILGRIQNRGEYDVVKDVQVLVAINKKSLLGRKSLNKILQGFLNPTGKQAQPNPFRINDKIINLKNGMTPADNSQGKQKDAIDNKFYVANGELGIVEDVQPGYTVARLENPGRLVRIPRGGDQSYQDDDGKGEGNGDAAGEDDGAGCSWDLAYAITTHKAQGAEWNVVITMIDSYPGSLRLCTKEHIYTSLSRGKKIVITIGRRSVVEEMIRKSGLWKRKTFLIETLNELRNAGLEREWELLLSAN
jgi:ATP-dependent exoDNAse (exonuclease V) alpha subunit